MLANRLISDAVAAVRSSEMGKKVLKSMDILRVSHLPVVDDGIYIGTVSDKFICELGLLDRPVGREKKKFDTTHVHEDQHIFEVAILMYKLKLSVMAVLNSDHRYLGAITLYDLARRFARYFSLQELGGIIVLEIDDKDYSIAQIGQIVESNDTKVLSFFMSHLPGTSRLELVLKLDKVDLSPVIQSFMRYDYLVKGVYLDHSMLNDLYQDRYDQFMKFMNI